MGFRQIYISKATKLSCSDGQLIVHRNKEEQPISFPIEDLDIVFLEDPTAVITARLLTELAQKGVAFMTCGSNYLPAAISIPFNGYYKQPEILKFQFNCLPSKKNKMWETLIKAKIGNQLAVLENTVKDENTCELLKVYIANVKFGDSQNMEGAAAKAYFRSLFGPTFIRFGDTPISSALNYGYSILTGALIRSCAFNGLNGNIGIWHSNMQNANNLACDLVEPFRPVVDYYVYQHMEELTEPLSKEFRHGLINLVNEYVAVSKKKYQVSYAMEMLVDDYVEYLKTGDITCVHVPSFMVKTNDESDECE